MIDNVRCQSLYEFLEEKAFHRTHERLTQLNNTIELALDALAKAVA